jgi:hypothetical protein
MITHLKDDKVKVRVLIKHYTHKEVYGAVDVLVCSHRLLVSTTVKANNNNINLKKYGQLWIKDVQHTAQLRALVNLIKNIQVSLKTLNFLAS